MSDVIPPPYLRQRRKRNEPKDGSWRQQKLKSIRIELTITTVFPYMFALGLAVCGLGLGTYFGVNNSLMTQIKYHENCTAGQNSVSRFENDGLPNFGNCTVFFSLDQNYTSDKVKFYYGLTKFYQNFRLYLSSRDDVQLSNGNPWDIDLDDDTCKPLVHNAKNIVYAPCGSIANSMFNDRFQLYYKSSFGYVKVPFHYDGIISNLEKKRKFKNPAIPPNGDLCDAFNNTAQPPSWSKPICELGAEDGDPDNMGFQNVDFMVWMNSAALPHFLKPYRFLNNTANPIFEKGLPLGDYALLVEDNYDVSSFSGEKYFVIAQESWMGTRNFFLPIVYMVTGVFIIVSFSLFYIIAKLRPRFFKVSE